MPPKRSKRKLGEEEALAKAHTTPAVSVGSQDTLSLEPKKRKKNADVEDADGDGEVSTRNGFPVTARTAHTDNFTKGRRTQNR
jgi:hypothetical protein